MIKNFIDISVSNDIRVRVEKSATKVENDFVFRPQNILILLKLDSKSTQNFAIGSVSSK
jgi:hypothetical protein